MKTKVILASIAAIFGLALVAGGLWLIRRRINRQGKSEYLKNRNPLLDCQEFTLILPPESPPIDLPEDALETTPTKESNSDSVRLALVASRIEESNLKGFLSEIANRVKEAEPCFDGETPFNFIEEMVDRLDDLLKIQNKQPDQVADDIESIRTTIIEIISKCGAEIIHSDVWDASIQRAIAKEATPGIAAPAILRFGSTGIRRHGQLVRKQEVVLAVPHATTNNQPTQ
jgi:molecular chaperone GrpE (heat shock protein)